MANVSRPRGLRPVQGITGAAWTGRATEYRINANATAAVGVGSIVALTGAADDGGEGLATVALLGTGYITGSDTTQAFTTIASIPVGVVVGFKIDPTVKGDLPIYRAASTSRLVLVCDDPMAMFEVQEDGNAGALAAASVGLNAALTASSVSTTTGFETQELDTSTAATNASLPVKILAFKRAVDNEVGSGYAKVIVRFTRHAYTEASLLGV